MNSTLHIRLEIKGRVQGVGYRYSAAGKARLLGINGFVKNLPSGHVILELEGTPDSIDAMIRWCWQGPPLARVDEVIQWDGPVQGYTEFQIR